MPPVPLSDQLLHLDWFMEWPEEALTSVSNKFLSTVDLGSPEVNKHVANMCVDVHMSVTQTSERFFQELRRKFYTTPKSYIDLINLYTALLAEKEELLSNAKDRLLNGLNKLAETNVIIDNLKIELGELPACARGEICGNRRAHRAGQQRQGRRRGGREGDRREGPG